VVGTPCCRRRLDTALHCGSHYDVCLSDVESEARELMLAQGCRAGQEQSQEARGSPLEAAHAFHGTPAQGSESPATLVISVGKQGSVSPAGSVLPGL
jgi:hypothetical protein